MSFFGKIFGTDKVRDEIIEGVGNVVYTEQEQAENHKKFLELYAPFKLAQRFLAIIFSSVYSLAWIVVFILELCSVSVPQNAIDMLQGKMAIIVTMIMGFYFFGGSIPESLRKSKK